MLQEIRHRVQLHRSFAFETTLSGLMYARLIPTWQAQGYAVKLFFISLSSIDLAVERVAMRVAQGGHAVPEELIRRRFIAGWHNFESTYKVLVDAWTWYDNSGDRHRLLGSGGKS